jgi:ligand-binding SRPBCC domain-containing protein
MSQLYSLTTIQNIPADMQTVWDFMSSPKNLQKITPPEMGFLITVDTPIDKMYPGLVISYKVSPLLGIKMNWVTEITHVKDLEYFVDEQRFGPYSFWHHKHFIEPIEGGVKMTDIIHYKLPLGVLGDIANSILVKKQLNQIFEFRRKKLIQLFGDF